MGKGQESETSWIAQMFSFQAVTLGILWHTYSQISRQDVLERVITHPSPVWLPPRMKYAGANISVLANWSLACA